MKTELENIKIDTYTDVNDINQTSVCSNAQDLNRLQKLFQIFIEIDNKLNKQRNEDNIRNTNNPCKA